MVLSGRSLPQTSRHGRLHSARLLPCASSFSEEVVEGNHRIMAEGTGLEPYSPCQGLVRGQGGLQDVQACVDLTIHLPVANEAHEILAHPISAPSATHWAGLTGPLRVDLDDGHAREDGFIFDLAMELAARPDRETPVHPAGTASCTVEDEVLQDDCSSRLHRETHEALGNAVEPLADAAPFPLALAVEESSGDPSIVGLLGRELPSASEVDLLDEPDTVEWNTEESCGIACGVDPIKGVLVRVEGNSAIGLVRLWGFLPHGNDDFPRDNCQGSESPRRVAQHRAVPVRERQVELHPFRAPNRDT